MLISMENVRSRLEAERDQLVRDLGLQDGLPHVRTRPGNHPADNATDVSEKVLSTMVRDMQSRHLAMIEDALRRLAQGRYGICEMCGQEINPERLEVQPAARLCVVCQMHYERVG